ncbi:hypothetical protein PAXINDRAFT_103074 [Paxillus involutus ATCC 200175]|uniref:Uncharacterized protein n=1 Tax=Paxillus involutus ATCC 200175 TaxID=664439 RepID=A0A0C9SN20_PAXIN|nr:hypothetical protein PAXINDRAFT_103074 [Paxillus involutus ATCC 200175]
MSHLNHYAAWDAPISEHNSILRLDREMNDILAYLAQTTDASCASAQWDNFPPINFPGRDTTWTQDLHQLPQDQIDPWSSCPSFQSLDEQTTSLGFEPHISGPLVPHLPSVAGSDMAQANAWYFDAPSPIQPDVRQRDFRDKAPAAHHVDTRFSWSTPDSVHTTPNNAYGTGIPPNPKTHPPITRQSGCPSTTFPSDPWGRLPPSRSGGPQTHECQWAADGTWCRALVQGDRREVMLHLNEKHGIPLTGDKEQYEEGEYCAPHCRSSHEGEGSLCKVWIEFRSERFAAETFERGERRDLQWKAGSTARVSNLSTVDW